MKPDASTSELHASRALDHLRAAVRYADRGRDAFFDTTVPDTYLLVEAELRKGFESLNRLGQGFFRANPKLDRDRVGAIRQVLTHDYADIEWEFVWKVAREDAPAIVRALTRARIPRREE